MAEIRLDGRRAVVTGGASGIGLAIARIFHDSGAAVTVLDRDREMAMGVAEEMGGAARAIGCDVSERSSVEAAFAEVAAAGPIDILVNSAGVAHVGHLLSTTDEAFERLYRVNVRGTYLCMQQAVERMKAAGSGVILNMASIAATAGISDRFAYSMTKGATLSMTLSVAKDFLADGIRCNCISPARVHTPFVDGFVRANYPGKESEAMERLSAAQPIGRMGKPAEVAMLALYLCSDAASFITGMDYPIDGGFVNLR